MAATARLGLVETAFAEDPLAGMIGVTPSDDARYPSRAPRQRTLIRASVQTPGIPGHDVIVRNVSTRGMCIAGRGFSPHMGEMLHVALPGGIEAKAEVRWVKHSEFGVALFADLDLWRLGVTNQRGHGGGAKVIHWLMEERLRAPVQPCTARLRHC